MFNWKVYSKALVFKLGLSAGTDVIGTLQFSSQLNGGQGQVQVDTNKAFDYAGIIQGDVMKAYSDGNLVYSGFVVNITRNYTKDSGNVSYSVVGIASVLSKLMYRSGGNLTFTVTDEPKNIIQAVLTYVNGYYNYFSYTGTVATYGSNISLNIANMKCSDVFNKIAEITGWSWHISASGQLYFGPAATFSTHKVAAQSNVESITIDEDAFSIINQLVLTTGIATYTESDATSISTYGLSEQADSRTEINDVPTKNAYKTTYFAANSVPKQKGNIVVSSQYANKDSIKPGDLVTVRNLAYTLANLQIVSVNWEYERATLGIKYIDNYTNIVKS